MYSNAFIEFSGTVNNEQTRFFSHTSQEMAYFKRSGVIKSVILLTSNTTENIQKC